MGKRLWAISLMVMLCMGLWDGVITQAQEESDLEAEQDVIQAINRWRVDEGIWPLQVNDTLNQMALDQANYVRSLPEMPQGGELHEGPNGETPRQRAAGYGWPHYNNVDQIAIGENAGIGTLTFVMRYWESSSIHRQTALNPEYREVGAAALMDDDAGYLYIVVFGSQPGVLPAVYHPENDQIYLTRETYRWAAGGDWMHTPESFRLFDAAGRPLSKEDQPWQPSIARPAGSGDQLTILYSEGDALTVATVLLPESLGLEPVAVALEPTTTPIQLTIVPTRPPTQAPAATPTRPSATVAAASSNSASAGVTLIYNARSLTLVNTGSNPVNVAGWQYSGSGSTLNFSRWTQFSPVALERLGSGQCLQAYSWNEAASPAAPSECRNVAAVVTLAPDKLFWTQAAFQVRQGDSVLVTCEPGAGSCAVPTG